MMDRENDRSDQMAQVMAMLSQAIQQMTAAHMAPSQVIRDPNGRVVGAQKRLN
jgi:hypothetical protein